MKSRQVAGERGLLRLVSANPGGLVGFTIIAKPRKTSRVCKLIFYTNPSVVTAVRVSSMIEFCAVRTLQPSFFNLFATWTLLPTNQQQQNHLLHLLEWLQLLATRLYSLPSLLLLTRATDRQKGIRARSQKNRRNQAQASRGTAPSSARSITIPRRRREGYRRIVLFTSCFRRYLSAPINPRLLKPLQLYPSRKEGSSGVYLPRADYITHTYLLLFLSLRLSAF
jgi:hypothetical protein